MGARDPGPETGTGTAMGSGHGRRPSCVARRSPIAADCRAAVRLIVGRGLANLPACRHQMQQEASSCRSQPCSVVVEIFFGVREPRGSCIRPSHAVVEYHGSRWKSQVWLWRSKSPNPPPSHPGGNLTAGSLGKSRVHTAEDPGFFTHGHLAPSGPRPKRESTAETCLGTQGPRWPRRV